MTRRLSSGHKQVRSGDSGLGIVLCADETGAKSRALTSGKAPNEHRRTDMKASATAELARPAEKRRKSTLQAEQSQRPRTARAAGSGACFCDAAANFRTGSREGQKYRSTWTWLDTLTSPKYQGAWFRHNGICCRMQDQSHPYYKGTCLRSRGRSESAAGCGAHRAMSGEETELVGTQTVGRSERAE